MAAKKKEIIASTYSKFKVRINFKNLGDLQPMSDVTPLESIQLSMLLVALSEGLDCNYLEFIQENNLQRHFVLTGGKNAGK